MARKQDPFLPGTLNELTKPSRDIRRAELSERMGEGSYNFFGAASKSLNQTIYNADITPISDEYIAQVFMTNTISFNDAFTKLPGHVYSYLYTKYQGGASTDTLQVIEVLAGVDCHHTCVKTMENFSSDSGLPPAGSPDLTRMSAMHKFYDVVVGTDLPRQGDRISVRYTDSNPKTSGVIISHRASSSVTGGPNSPAGAYAMAGAAGSVHYNTSNISTPVITDGKFDVSRAPKRPGRAIKVNGKDVWAMTRGQLIGWANTLGITEDLLLLAITVYSEVGIYSQQEQEAIFNTILNRIGAMDRVKKYQKDPTGRRDSAWGVVNTSAGETGKQGGSRQYATSRPPQGKALSLAITRIIAFLENRLKNGDMAGGAVNFQHNSYGNNKGRFEFVHSKWTQGAAGSLEYVTGVANISWLQGKKGRIRQVGGNIENHVRFYRYRAKRLKPNETIVQKYAKQYLGKVLDAKAVASKKKETAPQA